MDFCMLFEDDAAPRLPDARADSPSRRRFLQGMALTGFGLAGAPLPATVFEGQASKRLRPHPAGPRLSDSVDVALPGSEHAHDGKTSGRVPLSTAGDQVGGHDMRRTARTLAGVGSCLSYRVRVDPAAATLLELEELHGRRRDVIAYTVLVDGQPVAFRAWQGSGAGPVHHFVRLAPTGKRSVTVTLRNQAEAAWSLSRLWAWSDFDAFFAQSGMDVPFYLAPTVALNWKDAGADRAKLARIKASLGPVPHARPAWTTWIGYASLSDLELQERIDYVLRLAQDSGLPVQLAFDTWWGNTPSGSDGAGGFWTDVAYQQVVFNATKRRYELSVPNRWSNVPWLTVNHPTLNAWKAERLGVAVRYLAHRLCVTGQRDAILALNLDNEPVYWASGNAGLGSDLLLADFNPHAVEAAHREGVTLDPRDGLALSERRWLAQNLLHYNALIADAATAGLNRDSSIVDAAGTRPASDLLRHNVYTQAMVASGEIQFPLLDAAYPFWETAAPGAARVGGEWNGDSHREYEAVSHQIALGRNAAVNAECGNNAQHKEAVRPAYALAQRYVALYNYPLDQMHVAASDIADLAQPTRAFLPEPVLQEETFRDDTWKSRVVSHGGLQQGLIGNTGAIAIFPASTSEPGFLTYRLDAPHAQFSDGLSVELFGRAFVFGGTDPRVSITARVGDGPGPAAMTTAGSMSDHGDINEPVHVDLSSIARGKKTVYVRLELDGRILPPEVLSWCALYQIRFTTPWPVALIDAAPAQEASLAETRRRNLTVSWRRDAELALAELQAQQRTKPQSLTLAASHGPVEYETQAQQAYRRGAYAEAYNLANRGLCLLLPATFQVAAGGWLAPYPVRVAAKTPVTCVVHDCRPEEVRLAFEAEAATAAVIHIEGLRLGERYGLERQGATVTLRRTGTVTVGESLTVGRQGEVSFPVTIPAAAPPERRTEVRGVLGGRGGAELNVLPDERAGREVVPVNGQTTIVRGEAGQTAATTVPGDLLTGDRIVARLGPDGTALDVTATFELIEGVVHEFRQLTPFEMPFVVVGDEPTRHVLDLSAPLHTPQIKGGGIKSVPLGSVDVAPGDRVRCRCTPQTGRVYELWKLT